MKKKDIIISCISIGICIIMIIIGLITDIEYYSMMIFTMGIGGTTAGVISFLRLFHNTRPENIKAYQERIREQNIDKKDERKNQIRHRAGYITWLITVIFFLGASFVAAWLRTDKILIAVFLMAALFEYIVALIIYNYLCDKM